MENKTFHENPVIKTIYTADPAPMVCGDTLYLYTIHDEDGKIATISKCGGVGRID